MHALKGGDPAAPSDTADPRLLAIPASRSRVADYDPDYDAFSGISSTSRLGNPLYAPLYDV